MEDLLIPEVTLEENEDEILIPNNGDIRPFLEMDRDSKLADGDDSDTQGIGEIDVSMQIPDPLNEQELTYYDVFSKGDNVQTHKIHCTSCSVHLGSAPDQQHNRYIHPLLKVLVCKKCLEFYISGEFERGEDGSELYCRWCGQGGVVFCCSNNGDGVVCPYVFCKKCIVRNLGRVGMRNINAAEDWLCFICNPMQIIKHRLNSFALYSFTLNEIKRSEEANDPDVLKRDHSLCCVRTPSVRKLSVDHKPKLRREDPDFVPYADDDDDLDLGTSKRRRLSIGGHCPVSSSLLGDNFNNSDVVNALANNSGSSSGEQVVCTPDVSLIMQDVAAPPSIASKISVKPKAFLQSALLAPTRRKLKKLSDSDIRFIGQMKMRQLNPATPGQKFQPILPNNVRIPRPMILNTATNRPIANVSTPKFLQTHVTSMENNTVRLTTSGGDVSTPAQSKFKLKPGQKLDWMIKATQEAIKLTRSINEKVVQYNLRQHRIDTIESLVELHNEYQGFLTSVVGNFNQLGTSMKAGFISGLQKITLINTRKPESGSKVNDTRRSYPGMPNIKIRPASELMASSLNKLIDSEEPVEIDDDDDDCTVVDDLPDPIAAPEVSLLDDDSDKESTSHHQVQKESSVNEEDAKKLSDTTVEEGETKADLKKTVDVTSEDALAGGVENKDAQDFDFKQSKVDVEESNTVVKEDKDAPKEDEATPVQQNVDEKTDCKITPMDTTDEALVNNVYKTDAKAQDAIDALPVAENDVESDEEDDDPEIKIMILRAMRESTLENILLENRSVKHNLNDKYFEQMLSVRVHLESHYGTGLPTRARTPPVTVKQEQSYDFEEILRGTVLTRPSDSSQSGFGDAFSQFLNTSSASDANVDEGDDEENKTVETEFVPPLAVNDSVPAVASTDEESLPAVAEKIDSVLVASKEKPVEKNSAPLDNNDIKLLLQQSKHLSDVPLDEFLFDIGKSPGPPECASFDDMLLN